MQQRSEDAVIDQARTAPRIESDSTRQTSGSTSDDPTQSESAVPADDSQELPADNEPPTDQLAPSADSDGELEGPFPFTQVPPVVVEHGIPAVASAEGAAAGNAIFDSLAPSATAESTPSAPLNLPQAMSGAAAGTTDPGLQLTGAETAGMNASGSNPQSAVQEASAASSISTAQTPILNSQMESAVGSTESRQVADGSAREAVDASSNRNAREAIVSATPSTSESTGVTRSAEGVETAPGSPPSGSRNDSSSNPDSKQDRGRSLAKLLKAHSLDMEAAQPASSTDPAVSRMREIQQQLAHEHATPTAPQRGPVVPQGASVALGGGLDAGALEGRNTVLNNVLARTGAEAKLAEQTTQLTARGMTALASQRGGSLNIRLNPNSLGEVAIRMTVVEGVVRADLIASSAAARSMLEGGLDVLRGSMESKGLTVDRLVVQAAQAAGDSSGVRSESQNQGQSNQGGAREQGGGDGRQDAAGHESRGRGDERRDRSDGQDQRYSDQGTSFVHMMDEEST
jgi:flagellar hook-length control protein FliK